MIDIKLEPAVLELLRLLYWIDKSRNISSFDNKFSEIKEQLLLGGKEELAKDFANKCKLASKLLLNIGIPRWEREIHKNNFLNELNKFRIVVSSFVSEVMIASILRMEGFEVEFEATSDEEKVCDMIVNSFKVEVKTIFDQTKFSKTEDNLCKELEATLKRKKVTEHIIDALSKDSDIVILVLTFSSVGISVNDSTIGCKAFPHIADSLNNSIKLARINKSKLERQKIKDIPIIIIVTGADISNKIYKLSTLSLTYPVQKANHEQIVDTKKVVVNI